MVSSLFSNYFSKLMIENKIDLTPSIHHPSENSSDAFRPATAGRRGETPEKLAASPKGLTIFPTLDFSRGREFSILLLRFAETKSEQIFLWRQILNVLVL